MIKEYNFLVFIISTVFVMLISSCKVYKNGGQNNEIQIEICEHSNGADATIIQVTDQYFPSDWQAHKNDSRKYSSNWAEFLAFKYNIPLHVFEKGIKSKELTDFIVTGRGGVSVYYPSCNSSYTATKLFSLVSNLSTISPTVPTTVSYGCGKEEYADKLPSSILGGRNSFYTKWDTTENCITWYGENCGYAGSIDFSNTRNIKSRPCSGRFYTDVLLGASIEQASQFVEEQVNLTVNNSGFYVNFMHWHSNYNKKGKAVRAVPIMKKLFESISFGSNGANLAKVDYNQAVEYLYLKEAIDTAYLKLDKKNPSIQLKLNRIRDIDYSAINVPLTLKFRRNRKLKYRRIDLNENLQKVFEDENYVYLSVQLDLTKDELSLPITYGEKKKIPVLWKRPVLTFNRKEQIVNSSEPAKFILFRRKKNGQEFAVEVIMRSSDYSKQQVLPKTSIDYQYFIGAINLENESSLIELVEEQK